MTRPSLAGTIALLVALTACNSTGASQDTVDPGPTIVTVDTIPPDLEVRSGEPFPPERCEANRDAGTIVYLTGFDYAATASMVDVFVADAKGYYDELCLDVEVRSSFSTDNYPLIAANAAQFSSAGSFSEVVDFAGRNDAGFVVLSVEGRTGIDALIVRDGRAESLDDLRGSTIGVKGAMTTSVRAMLAKAGLVEGTDFETVLLDGFDPKVHIEVPGIIGFPGYKSNEPEQLARAGIPFQLFNPTDYDVPGSFGIIYTNVTFLTEFPTAAEDFMRATMRGLADAIADPDAAAEISVGLINAGGNALFLSPEGERARWKIESAIITEYATAELPPGVLDIDRLRSEIETYASIGLFDGLPPDISTMVAPELGQRLYDASGTVVWPGG